MSQSFTELGRSLIGLLLGVVILAGIAAAVLASTEGRNGSGSTEGSLTIGSGTTIGAVPGAASADIAAAAVMECQIDYQAVIEAVSYYEAVNGHPPASTGDLSTILKNVPRRSPAESWRQS